MSRLRDRQRRIEFSARPLPLVTSLDGRKDFPVGIYLLKFSNRNTATRQRLQCACFIETLSYFFLSRLLCHILLYYLLNLVFTIKYRFLFIPGDFKGDFTGKV